jgi:hypothetical protein
MKINMRKIINLSSIIILLIIVSHSFLMAQTQNRTVVENPSACTIVLMSKGFVIPFSFGANRSNIEATLGKGSTYGAYDGRVNYIYKNQDAKKYKWDFVEMTFVVTSLGDRLESFKFYFDKFDYQDIIMRYFRQPELIYSECSEKITKVNEKTMEIEAKYEIKCMDFIEYNTFAREVVIHKILYDYPFQEGERFGKISIAYTRH